MRLASYAFLLPALIAAPTAWAAPFSEPLVEMLPYGDALGDGLAPLDLTVVLLDTDGSPLSGLEGGVKGTGGEIGPLQELRPGLYRFTWTPPAVEGSTSIELRLRGKLPDKRKIDRLWSLPVEPPVDQLLGVSLDPNALIIGRDTQAALQLTLTGGAQASREGAAFRFAVNSGEIKNLTPMGEGKYTALYVPVTKGGAHPALLGIVDTRSPARTYGQLVVPLTARIPVDVKAKPGCKALLTVAGREFGPATVDAKGKARIEVVQPPGIVEATQKILDCPTAAETTIPLPNAEFPRVQILPLHPGLPGDDRVSVPVRAFVVTRTGAPDPGASLSLTTNVGTISGLRHEGDGVYLADYRPAAVPTPTPIQIEARLAGEEKMVARVPLNLVPVRPESLTLRAEPARLPKDATAFTLQLQALGAQGQGLPGRTIDLKLAGARLEGTILDNKDGTYTAKLLPTGKGPVEVIASVRAPAAGNPIREIVILPSRTRFPSDGLSSSLLTILTLDEFGYPVADAPLGLRLVSGDGQLPTKARTDANGVAQVSYTAGRGTHLVHVEVTAGGLHRGVALFQAEPTVAPEFAPDIREAAATPAQKALIEAWSPIVQRLWIERE